VQVDVDRVETEPQKQAILDTESLFLPEVPETLDRSHSVSLKVMRELEVVKASPIKKLNLLNIQEADMHTPDKV